MVSLVKEIYCCNNDGGACDRRELASLDEVGKEELFEEVIFKLRPEG